MAKQKTDTAGKQPKRVNVTDRDRALYLEKLCDGWTHSGAAQASGHWPAAFWKIRKKDPEFDQAVREAEDIGTDTLEDEARRRALDGVDRPVYQGGELVGHVREYSDTLITFLLKGRRPERFRERHQVEHTGGIDHRHTVLEGLTQAQLDVLEEATSILEGQTVDEAEQITKEAAGARPRRKKLAGREHDLGGGSQDRGEKAGGDVAADRPGGDRGDDDRRGGQPDVQGAPAGAAYGGARRVRRSAGRGKA